MATKCILCCHPVTPDKRQASTLDQRLFHCLCKILKTHGPNSVQSSLIENPVCSSCLDLLKTADDTLIKLEELELKIAKIAEDLKCTLKHGYSALKESWDLPGHEFEYVPTDVQKFLLKVVGVDTDEDYIEVVPLSHDEFKRYEEVSEGDAFSPLDTGAFNEDGDDDIEVIETENLEEAIQHRESQASEKSTEVLSSCGSNNKRKSPIEELPSRKRKRKCDENLISDSIEGTEILRESVMETSEVCSEHLVGGGKLTNAGQQKRKPGFCYCFYNGCRKGFPSIKTLRVHMIEPHDVEVVNTDVEFNCKKCEQSFPTYVDMFSHLASEHAAESNSRLASLFCQICGNDFTSVRALRPHMKRHSSKRRQYRCHCFYDGCREICESIPTLRAHVLKPHDVEMVNTDVEFNCKKCNQCFPTYIDMFNHLMSQHGAEANPRLVPIFCQKCGNDFKSVKTLKPHVKDHSSKRRQSRPAKRTEAKRNEAKRIEFRCFYDGCHEVCENTTTSRAHVLKPHDVEIVNTDMEFNCKKCKQRFPTYIDMFNHLTSQHGAEANPRLVSLFCQKCGNDFTSVKALKSHMKGHGGKKRRRRPAKRSEAKCCFYDGCNEICENINTLRVHVLRPHDVEIVNQNVEFSCDKCNQSFRTYGAMYSHLSSEHGADINLCVVKLLCQKCGHTYANVNRLKRHMRSHPGAVSSLLSCSSCGKCFGKENFLRRHEPVCRKIKGTGLRSCRICRKAFLNWGLYRKHMIGFNQCIFTKQKEHEKFVCRRCGKSFQKRKTLKKHYTACRYHRRVKLCPYSGCTKSFKGELMLRVHLHEPHEVQIPDDDNGKRPYFCCYVCKMLFLSYEILAEHIKQDHPAELPLTHLPCQLCGKHYKRVKDLRPHLKYHAGNFFVCDACGKICKTNGCLLKHLQQSSCGSNRRGGSHVCKGCSKSFKYERGLEKHRKAGCPAENKGPEDLHCKICGKECPTSQFLRKHEYNHKRKEIITCEVCQRKFESKGVLIRHRRSHFPEEKLSCHLCPGKYSSERHLRNHVNLKHFGKANHKCPHCDYICVEKCTLETHIRKHTGEKPFMCDICGMAFRSQQLLKNHGKIHIEKPNKCETCGLAFVHRYKLERHRKTHTNPKLHWKVRQKLEREAAKKAQTDSSSV